MTPTGHQHGLEIAGGRTGHHATKTTAAGTAVHHKPLPRSEQKIRALLAGLHPEHESVLVVA